MFLTYTYLTDSLGEERRDLINQLEDTRAKISQVEERNSLILREAEEQRIDLERRLQMVTPQEDLHSSPVSQFVAFNQVFELFILNQKFANMFSIVVVLHVCDAYFSAEQEAQV